MRISDCGMRIGLLNSMRLAKRSPLRAAAMSLESELSNRQSVIHVRQFAIPNPQSEIHTEEAARPAFSREDLLAARFRLAKVVPYQRSAKPFIGNLSLSILSGLLLVFSFPEWNFWSLGWVGTAPLIMAVARERRFWRSLFYG